jgi:hypothetical protein
MAGWVIVPELDSVYLEGRVRLYSSHGFYCTLWLLLMVLGGCPGGIEQTHYNPIVMEVLPPYIPSGLCPPTFCTPRTCAILP